MKVTQLCPTLCDPMSGEFSRQEYWSGLPCPSPGDLPNPGIKPRSSALHADSLLSELPGKPMNTGVDSLSLLQGIFLPQESNWGLLHYRRILYQLSYQRSPIVQLSCQNLAGMVRLQLVPGSQTPVRLARLLIGTEITILKCPLAS